MLNSKLRTVVEFIEPDKGIYTFGGQLVHGDLTNDLNLKNFIPRGSVLKNSDSVYVIVMYTGPDTKLTLN